MGGVGWRTDAPSGTTITGFDVWWVAIIGSFAFSPSRIDISAPASIYALEAPSLDQGARFGGDTAHGVGSESIAYSDTNHQAYKGLNTSNVALMAWCLSLCQGQDGSPGRNLADYEAYRLRTVLEDPAPPAGSVTGLADGARVGAPTELQATATDVGGGVREISLRVDGQVVQRAGPGGACADIDPSNGDPREYARMQPCPTQYSAGLTLSPTALSDGARHAVSIVATDAAGQDAVLGVARVALAAPAGFFASAGAVNPDLDVLNPRAANGVNGGVGRATVSFVVRRHNRTRLLARHVVAASDRQRIRGQLTSDGGAPIIGARVWLAAALKEGVWQISGGPLTTSKTGTVSGALPAHNPSRDVRLIYFPFSDSSENVQSPAVRLGVRSTTSIQLDRSGYRNGETAHFSGRITTRPMPVGKAVYLQAIVRGHWRTFDTARADAKGRWKLRYRFTATRQLTSYHFRCVVPRETQPVSWASGHSRVVRVLVTP
jgi:hypothetical protein